MELFRWRVRNWLLVVVAVLLIAHGMGKVDDQAEGSSGDDGDGGDSSPAVQAAPVRARHGHTRLHRRQHQHQRDHEHDHKQAQRAKLASHHHKQQAKHEPDAKEGTEAVPAPLTLPYGHSNVPRPLTLAEGEPHDLLDCEPQSGDKLLARAVVKAEFRPLGFAQASWFYPQNGSDQRTIHCVRALDQRRDGHGGYPKIERGGVGHHYVELSFTSDFSRGFHFVVEVYGQ